MDVDPVVGEEVLAVDDQRDGQEVAVAQALGALHDVRRGRRVGDRRGHGQRQRRDDRRGLEDLVGRVHGDALGALEVELRGRRVQPHLAAHLLDALGHHLPHLARAVAGVLELVDQGLDLVVLVADEGGLRGRPEAQALDALGGPLGAQLGRGDAPDLLGVALEEVRVQAPAEAVGHPLLEVVLVALALQRGAQVAQAAEHELPRAELLDDVHAVEGVVEELAAPEDAAHARAHEELVAHDLQPEVVDLLGLREEAMAAEVEAEALGVDDRLGDAADLLVGLEDDDLLAGLGHAGTRP